MLARLAIHRRLSSGAALGLRLGAAPVFAAMAVVTAVTGGDGDVLCGTVRGGAPFASTAVNSMATMYALMSAFHCGPWLSWLKGSPRGGARLT